MKHLKPFLSLLLAAIMVVSAGIVPVSAVDAGALAVSSATAKPGEEVEITIDMTANPGITVMKLNVGYDKALTLTNVEDQGTIPGSKHSPTYTGNPYKLYWENGTAYENITSTGTLVKMTFKVADDAQPGDYAITLTYDNENFDIVNFDFDTVEFAVTNGAVTVESDTYEEPTYEWRKTDNGYEVTATSVCTNDAALTITETVTAASEVTSPATCTEDGEITYTAVFKSDRFTTQTRKEPIPAKNHAWGEVTYTWADDNSTVTAERVCANDASHVETETVQTTATTTPATCEEAGKTVYTATFENEAFETQTKEVEIPAKGHEWGQVIYTWADDNSEVTAERVCSNDASHKETETVKTTADTTNGDCENGGTVVYTATFTNPAFETQTREVEIPAEGHKPVKVEAKEETCEEAGNIEYWKCSVCGKCFSDAEGKLEIEEADTMIPAKGHAWGAPAYTWAEDNSEVTAERICGNDASHKETETVKTTADTTNADCVNAGKTVYTATFENEAFETQTREVEIPAKGHELVKTDAKEATCEEAGNIEYYRCSVCGKCFSDAEGKTEIKEEDTVIPAKGHAWGAPVYTWADDNSTVTAERVCGNDSSHVETETAEAKADTADFDCTVGGTLVYTAEFENEAFETQTREVEVPAGDHNLTAVEAKEATCENAGNIEYWKCSVCGKCFSDAEGKTEIAEEDTVIPAKGHDWGEPVFTWSDDYKTAKAEFVCRNDDSHKETIDADVTSAVSGTDTVYTAKVTGPDGKVYTDRKTVAGGQTPGHSDHPENPGKPSYPWDNMPVILPPYILPGDKRPVNDPVVQIPGTVKPTEEPAIADGPSAVKVLPFTDVTPDNPYYSAIRFVYNNGLFIGMSDTEFAPDTTMTRAMFVTVLGRLEKADVSGYTGTSFKDVEPGMWYSEYVEWAAEKGIIVGYGDGNFGPYDLITKEQAALIIARYARLEGNDTTGDGDLTAYEDGETVSAWAEAAVDWCEDNGIYVAEQGKLIPQGYASRAIVAQMLYAYILYAEK